MKNIIQKGLVVGVVAAIVLFMGGLAQAKWQCNIHNEKGQAWYGVGDSKADASGYAMTFCSANTKNVNNCVIDTCFTLGSKKPAPKPKPKTVSGWTCTSLNARGSTFETLGDTKSQAAANATQACVNNSTYASNCHIIGCKQL